MGKLLKRKRLWGQASLGLQLPSALIALLMAVPLVYLIYQGLSVSPEVWERLWRLRLPGLLLSTLALAGTISLGALSLGLLLAWLVERTDLPGRKLFRPLLLAPLIIPCYLVAIAYAAFFGVGGLLEKALRAIFNGWQLSISITNLYGFGGAALVLTLATYPYVYVLARAALSRLDPTLEEAARCLGVGRGRIFWRVTLPLLRPALSAGGLLSAVYALSDFGVVTTLRYPTFVAAIYQQITGRYDPASAAALSTVLIALTLLLLWAQGLVWGRRRYTPEKLSGRPRSLHQLGRWRWPALAIIFLVLGAGLLLPLSVFGYWLVENWRFNAAAGPTALIWGTSATALTRYALNSFSASAAAATLAVLLALPLAYWTVRHRDLAGQGLAWGSQAGQALPGVLIALALAFILYRFLPALYFTVAAVVLAYLVRFFPQALQAIRAGLAQVPARLEEGARLLGHRPMRAFYRVTLPLLWPALGAGWTLVFLNALRELPATLLLRPAGFDTLPVRVWIAAGEGFYAQAAPAALLLVGLSLPLLFLLQREAGGTRAYE